MPYKLTEKLRCLTPYQPISGDYQIRLDANESFLQHEKDFADQLGRAISEVDFNRYPDPYAAKLCGVFAQRYGIDASYVTAGNGSDELIGILMSAFLTRGESILTLQPDFSMYEFYASLSECKVEKLCKGDDLKIDPTLVLDTLKKTGARLLIFSNPCNPTSLGFTCEEVAEIIQGTDALVVVDEAYMDFWDQPILSIVHQYNNAIVLRTCSKAIGAAAVRLGFAISNERITKAIRAAKSPYNVSSLTQSAGEFILSKPDFLDRALQQIICSKNELQLGLEQVAAQCGGITKVYHSCTNFIFLELVDAKKVYEALLDRSIAVRLMGSCLRITAGTNEENRILIESLKQILAMEDCHADC